MTSVSRHTGAYAVSEGDAVRLAALSPSLSVRHLHQMHRQVHTGRLVSGEVTVDQVDPAGAWCMVALPDADWWASAAIHEAAHAVVGAALGLRLVVAHLARDRTLMVGGGVSFSGPGDAQHFAVWLVAGVAAQQRWLAEHDYTHPELHSCLRNLAGAGDDAAIDAMARGGFRVDRDRALADASRILGDPNVRAAVDTVAAVLLDRPVITDAELAELLHRHQMPTATAWIPCDDNPPGLVM
jgi:hypothetical protein